MVIAENARAPVILKAQASPSAVARGGGPVLFHVRVAALGAAAVTIDLSPWGLGTLPLEPRDIPRTQWALSTRAASSVAGGEYALRLVAVAQDGARSESTVVVAVREDASAFAVFRSPHSARSGDPRFAGPLLPLLVDPLRSLASVRFEYRGALEETWLACAEARNDRARAAGVDRRPTGKTRPTGILWDATALPDGDYDLRALSYSADGETDPHPEYLRVRKDSAVFAEAAWLSARGLEIRRLFTEGDTGTLGDGTALALLPGALGRGDSVWIRIALFGDAPPEAPPPPVTRGLTPLGGWTRFEREDGRNRFDGDVIIGLPFDPSLLSDPRARIAIYHFDPGSAAWIREEAGAIDLDRNIAWATVRHFTDFAVFGSSPATGLASVIVYPNPFVPYDGIPENGAPYRAGDFSTGVVFKNVTNTVDIDVYTIAGRRAARIHASNTGGSLHWDARSDDGRELASGVYLCVIRAPSGEQVTRKVVIVR
jgi:hypothetical protein